MPSTRRPPHGAVRRPSEGPRTPVRAHDRFLALEPERAEREWKRYEGTPQRELFRQLRERFLQRHAAPGRWALDVGSGPGRFLPFLGPSTVQRVAIDLSRAMLEFGRMPGRRAPAMGHVSWVQGDALRPPFSDEMFSNVALVGNALGFEGEAGEGLLYAVERLVAPEGILSLEIAPGPGERSRYLARLPASAVRRLLAAPPAAVLPRLRPEGFRPEPARHRPIGFRRWTADELLARWRPPAWQVLEVAAVAPALGADQDRLAEVARDPRAWSRLIELEERLGSEADRWPDAAAVLLAVRRGR